GILEEYRRHGDRYGDHGGCAPDPDRPVCGGLSSLRAGVDLGDGLLPLRPKFHGSRLWRRPAVRTVAVTRPPRGHQRPPVLRSVNGRVVRDHEPLDRPSPTHRNRVPERGSREPGASVGGRRRVIELSIRILVERTFVRRGGLVMSSVTLTPAAISRPAVNPWLVGVAVVVPTFMEILDTTIATASLRYIAGGLSASMDDSDWVMTSYLAANATILPITGWISAHLGRRNYFLLSIAVFTIASVLFGVAGLIAPVIGPTLGGYITVNYNWRWIFLINLPIGAIGFLASYLLVDDPDYLKKERAELRRQPLNFDYIGLGLLALMMACWEVLLSKGQERDWYNDPFGKVQTLAVLFVVCLGALVFRELRIAHPVVNFR